MNLAARGAYGQSSCGSAPPAPVGPFQFEASSTLYESHRRVSLGAAPALAFANSVAKSGAERLRD